MAARTAATGSTSRAFTASVAPKRRAASSFSATTSTAITCAAPHSTAPWMLFRPTPPAPITATVAPGSIAAVLATAPKPVMTPQASRAAWRMSKSSGTTASCEASTTTRSANAPVRIPWPIAAPPSVASGLASPPANTPSHSTGLPRAQGRQWPQARISVTTTRAPMAGAVTPGPVASTVPAASWPNTAGRSPPQSPSM